jgi:Ca2+/Na+ antiporter
MNRKLGWTIILVTLAIILFVVFTKSDVFFAKIGEYVMMLLAACIAYLAYKLYHWHTNAGAERKKNKKQDNKIVIDKKSESKEIDIFVDSNDSENNVQDVTSTQVEEEPVEVEEEPIDKKKKYLFMVLLVFGFFALFAIVAGLISQNIELNIMIGKGLIIVLTLVIAVLTWMKFSEKK